MLIIQERRFDGRVIASVGSGAPAGHAAANRDLAGCEKIADARRFRGNIEARWKPEIALSAGKRGRANARGAIVCAAARESGGGGASDEKSDRGTSERVATVELGRISPKKIIVAVPPAPPPVRSFGAARWFIGGALIAGAVGGYMLGYAHRMTAPERSSSVAEAVHAIPAKEPVAPRETARAPIASAQASQRHLDASEITFLMKGGTELMAHGDIVAARKMFQRAAEADDATAAFALAETYDPLVLKKLATTGFMSDTALAHQWYEKAKELGSTAAPGRLVGVTR